MRIEALDEQNINSFIDYCKKHRIQLDDSFMGDEDLRKFQLGSENPTYILKNEHGDLVGAASLMIDDYRKRAGVARFRILHSEIDESASYNMLMHAIGGHIGEVDKLNLFVPMQNEVLIDIAEKLNFEVERYSFLLVRDVSEVPAFSLPEDYEIKTFTPGKDEEEWCAIRNAGFAKLKGSETPINSEMVSKMILQEDHIDGGMMILFHKDRAVGIIRGTDDEYNGEAIMGIGPLAILPEYQGKGLGRSLLRAALNFAKAKGYKKAVLCVNAENERAKALYINEGFYQVEGAACYSYAAADIKL